jgi:Ser/Thr protein kinase RdoA (MazF antagonist)
VATVLARVHAAPIPRSVRPGQHRLLELPLPPLRAYPDSFRRQLPDIARARAELVDLVAALHQRSPRVGLTHNDIFEGNVLVDRGHVTAVLDWGEATMDWLVWDVASSLWPFCSARGRLDLDATAAFLAAYRAGGGPMPTDEDDLIIPLVRARRILEVLRAPTDRHPRWNAQQVNLRAYQRLEPGPPSSVGILQR